ncbi:MAG: NAD(P)-dependent malic enzyme [Acidobacteriota bacterium]
MNAPLTPAEEALREAALEYHRLPVHGKISITPTKPLSNQRDLSLAYSPGVAYACLAIEENPALAHEYTSRGNLVGVVTNGTAVLGLGDIGPLAGKPVMEGKGVLFKTFADVDVFDIEIKAPTVEEMVRFCQMLEPTVGGINLEDIKAPECFEIERRLQEALDIPVFHDDQHGTAIVALAAVFNAARGGGKRVEELRVVIVGTGAAGVAVAELLHDARVGQDGTGDIIGVDSTGILHRDREHLTPTKQWFVEHGNCDDRRGGVREALQGADVLLGLSGPGIIQPEWLAEMADDAIVFAMANPIPEVMPELMPANVSVIATGRSDYPNQINNVLAFPGVFRGLLDVRATRCTIEIKRAAADALASLVTDPVAERIIPGAFEHGVADAVADAVRAMALEQGVVRR